MTNDTKQHSDWLATCRGIPLAVCLLLAGQTLQASNIYVGNVETLL